METTTEQLNQEMRAIQIKLQKDEYVIDENVLRALQALSDFAENTFQGYSGELGTMEQNMMSSFQYLAREYMEFVVTLAREEKRRLLSNTQC